MEAIVGCIYHNDNNEIVKVLRVENTSKHPNAVPITVLYIQSKKVKHFTQVEFDKTFKIDSVPQQYSFGKDI